MSCQRRIDNLVSSQNLFRILKCRFDSSQIVVHDVYYMQKYRKRHFSPVIIVSTPTDEIDIEVVDI